MKTSKLGQEEEQLNKNHSVVNPQTGWIIYYPNRETTLYYVSFKSGNKTLYKLGITTQTIEKRFAGERLPYKILWSKTYKSGRTAYNKEQAILLKYRKFRYEGPDILKSGNSELFTKNILKGTYEK